MIFDYIFGYLNILYPLVRDFPHLCLLLLCSTGSLPIFGTFPFAE